MSSRTWGILIAGLVVVVVVMAWILWKDRAIPANGDQIESPVERIHWQQQVDAVGLDFGLAATRASAGKWAASSAAILGVLSAVAVVAGPDNLADDVGGTEALIAAVLILTAAAAAVVATLLAGLAEQGSPVKANDLTPEVLRRLTRERAGRAAAQIWWSRVLTTAALVLIFAAVGIAWLAALTGEDPVPDAPSAMVTGPAGVTCGTLVTTDSGIQLRTDQGVQPIPQDARITVVDTCPGSR